MKIGDKLIINGTVGFVREFEREDTLVKERDCTRWIPTDNIEQMIVSGEATLIPKGEKKNG